MLKSRQAGIKFAWPYNYTEKFDKAQETLADAVAVLKQTHTASTAICKVHAPNDLKT